VQRYKVWLKRDKSLVCNKTVWQHLQQIRVNHYIYQSYKISMLEKPHWIHFTGIGDEEVGYISVAQKNNLPFEIKRVYWVYETPEHIERGNHAHVQCRQVLIAVNGAIDIELENTDGEKELFHLNTPSIGLFVPVMHWRKINMKKGSVLLSLASHDFDEDDYIRDYEQFNSL